MGTRGLGRFRFIFCRIDRIICALLFSSALIVACGHPSKAFAEDVLRIGGVGSALPSMELVAGAFQKSHRGVKVQVVPSLGSSGGIKAVLDGAIDIGLSGRPLKDEEQKKGAIGIEYAITPFVFVTHNTTPAYGLSTRELVEIYDGKRQTWSDGTRVRLVLRPESDVDTTIVKRISREMELAVKAALSRQGMIVAITNQDSDKAVEATRGSLGTSTLAQVISERRSLKVLSFNGVRPSVKALDGGTYPLAKHFYLITVSRKTDLAKQFISFLFSQEGRKILLENGNMPSEDKSMR